PNEILFDWVQEDSTDFGLILYTEQEDAFLEIYSSEYTYDDESVFNPNVNFDYYYTAGDSILDTYDQELNEDTFIYSHDFNYQNFTGQLFVSNIRPVRMLVKIGLEDSIFINMDNSGIEDNDDYRRMTINRAEIILVSNDSEPYPLDGSFSLRSYLVTADSLDFNDISVPLVPDGGYEFLYDDTVTDTLGTEAFSVDVTNIIQYITSGERENKGIMIRSIYENKDFKHMAFATSEDSDELIRPVLKIIYTPPYLDDEK
ncbi:MAG: hypothetical protein JXB60_04450, partial [Candidatus Cloacimonetes bacterium]|nr:hypothetical protein [Candidatus Cloacimonadota bacterium]